MNTKDSDLNFSPSESMHSPTDDTLAKAVAVDSLWTFKLTNKSMTSEDENKAIRDLTCNMDARSVEFRDLTVSRAFIADICTILSRSTQIDSVSFERITVRPELGAKTDSNYEAGMKVDLSRMAKLKQVDVLGCRLESIRLPGSVTDLALDRCVIEESNLAWFTELRNLSHFSIVDICVAHSQKGRSESLLATWIADVMESAVSIGRVHTTLEFEHINLEAKKRILKAIARNRTLQFISYRKRQQISSPIAKREKSSKAKQTSSIQKPPIQTSAKSCKNTRLFSQGKEEIHWSISRPRESDYETSMEHLQLVAETAVDPFADGEGNNSVSQSSSDSDCEQFVTDFIDCNLRANRFIARHGIESVKQMLEEGTLPESLTDGELADVMHRLLTDKLAEVSAVDEDINNRSGDSSKYEDDLNQAVLQHRLMAKSVDYSMYSQIQAERVDTRQSKDKKPKHKVFREQSGKPKRKFSSKPYYEDTIEAGFELHPLAVDKPVQMPLLSIGNQKPVAVVKTSSRQKTNRSISSRRITTARRKSFVEPGTKCAKAIKTENQPKVATKQKKETKVKTAKNSAFARKESVMKKPKEKPKVDSNNIKSVKMARRKSKIKTDRGNNKENCQLLSNQGEKCISKEFTFHRHTPGEINSTFKIHHLEGQNIQLTDEKVQSTGVKRSVSKSRSKKAVKLKSIKTKLVR